MVHLAPLASNEGNYEGNTYRIKGDDRVEMRSPDGQTTMHANVVNALDWVDGHVQATGVDPATAAIGDPELTLTVTGTDFLSTSVILFNGGEEPTTFVDTTTLTTLVDPSTATTPGDYPVQVRTGSHIDDAGTFTFTDAA